MKHGLLGAWLLGGLSGVVGAQPFIVSSPASGELGTVVRNSIKYFSGEAYSLVLIAVLAGWPMFAQAAKAREHQPAEPVADIPTSEPADLNVMIGRMARATAIARRAQGDPPASDRLITREEGHFVLLSVHYAVQSNHSAWRGDARFLDHLGVLLDEVLQAKIGSVESMPMIFDAVSFLPDSEQTSDIILGTLRQGGSLVRLWDQRLYERITPADIAAIRDHVLSLDDIEAVGMWEMDILAAEGSPASQSVLEQLAARARRAEAALGRRLLSGRRSHEIGVLVALGPARAESETLLEWGIEAPGGSLKSMGLWAFDEVLDREGPNAPIWDETWVELESRTRERAAEYLTKMFAQTGGKPPSAQNHRFLLGRWLFPWVRWADENGVTVPPAVRRLVPADFNPGLLSI